MNTILTLGALRAALGLAPDAGTDGALLAAGQAATALLAQSTARRFLPVRRTRTVVVAAPVVALDEDLLVLEALASAGGDAIALQDVVAEGAVGGPWYALRRADAQPFACEALHVSGIWGWHDDYANAWGQPAGALLVGASDAAATSLTLADASGFDIGHLLRVDDEFMVVTAITGDALTVRRGQQGTLAASHDAGAAVAMYRPPELAAAVALALAGGLVQGAHAGQPWLPPELRAALASLVRARVA
jgi:hypothetical protein